MPVLDGALDMPVVVRCERPSSGVPGYENEEHEPVLPTRQHIAVAVPGNPDQVVISRGLLASLSTAEVRVVIRHELAHVRQHHSRYLLIEAALRPIFRHVPPLRASLAALRLSIESSADSAAWRTATDRERARQAILRLSLPDLGSGAAALNDAETCHERLQLLEDPQGPAPGAGPRVAAYAPAGALALAAFSALVGWFV